MDGEKNAPKEDLMSVQELLAGYMTATYVPCILPAPWVAGQAEEAIGSPIFGLG